MFKKKQGGGGTSGLSAKIAHTTLMPSLVGNKDLKLLQDFITAEKSVVISMQKLAIDTARAAETLKLWGQGEGDDLGVSIVSSFPTLNLADPLPALGRTFSFRWNDHAFLRCIKQICCPRTKYSHTS
jgi:hypothetical protein